MPTPYNKNDLSHHYILPQILFSINYIIFRNHWGQIRDNIGIVLPPEFQKVRISVI